MKLKEDLISKLKIGQFSPIIFGEVSMDVWDRKIEAREDFDLFFNSELLKYEQEYFQINSPPLAFIIKNFNSISLFKCYLSDESIFLFPLCFSDSFDYKKGIKVSKIISSYFKNSSFKIQFMNLPFTNNLTNHFKLQIQFTGVLKPSLEMYVDLNSEDLWGALRKSYRSLINFGKKNLKVVSEFNTDLWDECNEFHFKIAGRKTRNKSTWNIQKNMIEKNIAKIFYIREEGKILGFALFNIAKCSASYSVGVYDRSKFDKISISHIILWHAIQYFKSNGFDNIYLGEYAPEKNMNDKKLDNINHFKLGFCNNLVSNNYLSNE
tara:strand:- start:1107 stop:2072 length:966 start_codon:yes stop_codon:yes gene_type:complete